MTLAAAHAMKALALGSLVVGGCAYRADSFEHAQRPFDGVYLTVDCLDLAIEHRQRRRASVIEYHFGNRCDQPALVDLAAARVYEQAADGSATALVAYDPKGEIRPGRIDARAVGREAIEYPRSRADRNLCIDVASIARARPARWVCFYRD